MPYGIYVKRLNVVLLPTFSITVVNNKDMKTNKYKCVHCNKVVKRESDKQWIKSYCDETGKNVRLQKQ